MLRITKVETFRARVIDTSTYVLSDSEVVEWEALDPDDREFYLDTAVVETFSSEIDEILETTNVKLTIKEITK